MSKKTGQCEKQRDLKNLRGRKTNRLAFVAGSLICCASMTIAVVASGRGFYANPKVLAGGVGAKPGNASAESPNQPKLTDSVLVTITPGGFDTAQITAPAVPFFLLVENRSGLEEVSLQLDRVNGPRVRQAAVPQERLDWSDLVDLSPGEYVLSEANHPAWICQITITAK